MPEIVWEAALGVYLTVKGFRLAAETPAVIDLTETQPPTIPAQATSAESTTTLTP
jgi:hypothetical protein